MNKDLVSEFLAENAYAPSTERTYRDILSRLLSEFPSLDLTSADLLSFLSRQGWGDARQCLGLAACRKFIGWQCGQNHPALSARKKRTVGKPQRALDAGTAARLLALFDRHSPKGARDLAIASLALDTGLRCSELCRLQNADTDTEHGVLQVLVKGGQWKAAVFSIDTAAAIQHWCEFRKTLRPQGFLFVNTVPGKRQGRGLTPEGLFSIVETWGLQLGIKLSPHDFRRSFATLATLNGAPERVLMEGGRWNHSEMIQRYTRTLRLEAMRAYLPVPKLDKSR